MAFLGSRVLKISCLNTRTKFTNLSHPAFLSSFMINRNDVMMKKKLYLTENQMSLVRKSSSADLEYKHHDHVKHWNAEKILTIVQTGLIPAAFVFPSTGMDMLLALILTVHSHWGIEAVVVDYIRPSVFGYVIPKISLAFVYALSFAALGALWYYIYTDIGIVNAIKLLWSL